jgi:hypothetical protein
MMPLHHNARLLLAALAVGLSGPLAGQEPDPAPPSPRAAPTTEAVTIPFAPPLGTPLTYALRFERKRTPGDSTVNFEQRLTFERLGEGYVLRLETLALASGGQRFDLTDDRVLAAIPAALRPYLMPMTVELDAAGEMVRMRDWESAQAALRQLPESIAAITGQRLDEKGRAAVRSVLAPIFDSSAEQAPALLIRGWPAFLGYGGSTITLDKAMAEATEVVSGLSPVPIPAILKGTLTRGPDGNLRLLQTTQFDEETMRAAAQTLVDTIRQKAEARGSPPPDPGGNLQAMKIIDELEIVFDSTTGLPVTARTERLTTATTSTGEAVTAGEILTIRRIAP